MEEILQYENLIYSIIRKYSNFDKDDMYQVGMLGLINAYKNYDKKLNVKFSTYAYFYIIGEIKKYIRESSTIKISRELIKLNKSIEKAKDIMRQRLKKEPTIKELSQFLEIEEEKIKEAQLATEKVKSLDYSYDDESYELYNSIKTEDKTTRPDILDLKNELMNLKEEEKELIIDRYFNEFTQKETSKHLGISQVQVSRKETKILQKLKSNL